MHQSQVWGASDEELDLKQHARDQMRVAYSWRKIVGICPLFNLGIEPNFQLIVSILWHPLVLAHTTWAQSHWACKFCLPRQKQLSPYFTCAKNMVDLQFLLSLNWFCSLSQNCTSLSLERTKLSTILGTCKAQILVPWPTKLAKIAQVVLRQIDTDWSFGYDPR